jgi:hypothetical protein
VVFKEEHVLDELDLGKGHVAQLTAWVGVPDRQVAALSLRMLFQGSILPRHNSRPRAS